MKKGELKLGLDYKPDTAPGAGERVDWDKVTAMRDPKPNRRPRHLRMHIEDCVGKTRAMDQEVVQFLVDWKGVNAKGGLEERKKKKAT